MKRTLLVAFVAFVAATSMALATETRVKTMGRVGNFVYDDANIFDWPSTVVGFSDRFILELGEDAVANDTYDPMSGNTWPNGFGGGAIFNVSDIAHLGFYVNANDRANGGGISDSKYFPTDPTFGQMTMDERLMLLLGIGMDNLDLGLNLNFAGSSSEQTDPSSVAWKASVARIGAEGGLTYWMGDDNSVDLALQFEKTFITEESGGTTTKEDDGYQTFQGRARMFYNLSDNVQLVPYAALAMASRGAKWDDPTDSEASLESNKDRTFSLDLAIGVNQYPVENLQIIAVGGVLLQYTSITSAGTDSSNIASVSLPYVKAGIDAEVRSWLDVRAGVEKRLSATGTEILDNHGTDANEEDSKVIRSDPAFSGYLGSGIHLGDLTIDLELNPQILFNGPNFISGQAAQMNNRISIVRPW